MNKARLIAGIFFIMQINAAMAAVCNIGYYNKSGTCTTCETGYYCPGDDTRHTCPVDTTDWYTVFTNKGYTVLRADKVAMWSWGPYGGPAETPANCHAAIYVDTSIGKFYMEPWYTGTDYNSPDNPLWYQAAAGYYLTSYYATSNNTPWYLGIKPCTNLPEKAHYTGAGTPDATDGSFKDKNDCPWECEEGLGNHNGECVPLCRAGINRLQDGRGNILNLYPQAYSSPTIVVAHNGQKCYGVLQTGAGENAINISVAGTVYHMTN